MGSCSCPLVLQHYGYCYLLSHPIYASNPSLRRPSFGSCHPSLAWIPFGLHRHHVCDCPSLLLGSFCFVRKRNKRIHGPGILHCHHLGFVACLHGLLVQVPGGREKCIGCMEDRERK